MDTFGWIAMAAKAFFVFFVILNVAPIMAWVERRGSAMMQNRLGPNRIGPLGLFQSLADAVKFIFKEDVVPAQTERFYYILAPILSVVPTFMTFAVVPFAGEIQVGDHLLRFQLADLNVGLLYILSVGSLGVYGIIMGSWASNNKYALLGGLRSASQMISYELSLGLSIIGIVMAFSTVSLYGITMAQAEPWFTVPVPGLGALSVDKWGILIQPLGFLVFLVSTYAETNRLPFDLPEGESEIVAGYHLEYGSMKFALFQMAEYGNMFVASSLVTVLFLGGFNGLHWVADLLPLAGDAHEWARIACEAAAFFAKACFLMWVYVWVRWTIPRFRYDQLMDLGWKVMLPLSLLNIFATGVLIYYKVV